MALDCRSSAAPFRTRNWVSGFAALTLAACTYPTETPQLEQRWIVPLEETRFGVGELLQAGEVELTPDSSAFEVTFDPVQFQETLGTLCAACVPLDGTTVPKPPFLSSFQSDVAFPASVSAVTVSSGQVDLVLTNGFNFDPLRPGAGVTGTLTVTITDSADGDVLGTLSLDGVNDAFPASTTLNRTIELVPGTVNGTLEATVAVDSPLGDPVTLDNGLFITATATPQNIVVSSVDVDVSNETVDLDPVALDLQDVDQEIADRLRCEQVQNGSPAACRFSLEVENPFRISANFTLQIVRPGLPDLVKQVTIPSDIRSTSRVEFTAEELRSLIGRAGVELRGGAVVSPIAGVISVAPGDELVLEATLDVTIAVGGGV